MVYDDVSDSEALKWSIDSVCVVPKDCKQVESVYSVEADQLGVVSRYVHRTINKGLWHFLSVTFQLVHTYIMYPELDLAAGHLTFSDQFDDITDQISFSLANVTWGEGKRFSNG